MKYAFLIYGDDMGREGMDEAAAAAEVQAYFAFNEEVTRDGVLVGGEALHPVTSATTVRVRDGQHMHTDGPFAETKEQLGGFYILECENLDQALEYAAKIPGAASGCVEVRPLLSYG